MRPHWSELEEAARDVAYTENFVNVKISIALEIINDRRKRQHRRNIDGPTKILDYSRTIVGENDFSLFIGQEVEIHCDSFRQVVKSLLVT